MRCRCKVDFLENKASNEKFLFYIVDFFFRVESPPFRLYHQLPTTLYIHIIYIFQIVFNVNLLRKYKEIVDSVKEYKCCDRCSFNFEETPHER